MSESLPFNPFAYPDAVAKQQAVGRLFEENHFSFKKAVRFYAERHKIAYLSEDIFAEWFLRAHKAASKFDPSRPFNSAEAMRNHSEIALWRRFLLKILERVVFGFVAIEQKHQSAISYDQFDGDDENSPSLDYVSFHKLHSAASVENLCEHRELLTYLCAHLSREEWDEFCAYLVAKDGKGGLQGLARKLGVSYDNLRQRHRRIKTKVLELQQKRQFEENTALHDGDLGSGQLDVCSPTGFSASTPQNRA